MDNFFVSFFVSVSTYYYMGYHKSSFFIVNYVDKSVDKSVDNFK